MDVKSTRYGIPQRIQKLNQFIEQQLTNTLSSGAVEEIREELSNTITTIALLVNLLADKGLITAAEVIGIVRADGDLEFVSHE